VKNAPGSDCMNLSYDDEVVAMQLNTQGEHLLIVSEYGMGKRTRIEEFAPQHRGGKGIKCYKITEKTGNVVSVKAVNEENEIMLITTEGIIIQMRVDEISVLGRITSGVKLIDLDPNQDIVVATMAKVRDSQPSDSKDSFLEEMENEEGNDEANNLDKFVEIFIKVELIIAFVFFKIREFVAEKPNY
jgi:DNA gyrase subunit A